MTFVAKKAYDDLQRQLMVAATREMAIKQAVQDAFESVDMELRRGTTFPNVLLAVSARIALAWIDIDKEIPCSTDTTEAR